MTAETLASTVNRHTNSVVEVLRGQVALAASDLVPQSLPETCLIRLAMAVGPAEPHLPDIPDITLNPNENTKAGAQISE